jgi:hypothetical protein
LGSRPESAARAPRRSFSAGEGSPIRQQRTPGFASPGSYSAKQAIAPRAYSPPAAQRWPSRALESPSHVVLPQGARSFSQPTAPARGASPSYRSEGMPAFHGGGSSFQGSGGARPSSGGHSGDGRGAGGQRDGHHR